MEITRHLIIVGRVQGVGYRDALCRQAQALRVTGWVRNRRDGSVEAVLRGPPDSVTAAIEWCRRGPPAARVTQVQEAPAAADLDRPYPGFEWRPTA